MSPPCENGARADAGRSQIMNEWCAKAACADNEDARRLQLLLAWSTDIPQHDMAGITLDFI